MNAAQSIADRYVAVWNERDPEARRQAIRALWAPDALHYVDTREARGYDALEQRIIGSHNRLVRDAGNQFRAVHNAQALRNVVTFNWDMMSPEGGKVLAVGLQFLTIDENGRILIDYQFMAK